MDTRLECALYANRAIVAGEEICWYYGEEYVERRLRCLDQLNLSSLHLPGCHAA